MPTSPLPPLWTEERIEDAIEAEWTEYGEHYEYEWVHGLMMRIYADMQAALATLAADNARLRETLAFAARYKGFEGRACPLCTYENGKFVKRCQMHTDMDNLRAELEEARAWVPIEVATFSTDCETLAIADNELSIISSSGDDIETIGFTLPKSYRVCQRRAPSAGEVVDDKVD